MQTQHRGGMSDECYIMHNFVNLVNKVFNILAN